MDIAAKVLHVALESDWWLNDEGFSEASEGCPAAGCADIPSWWG